MTQSTIGEDPYKLVFGVEAMILAEVVEPSMKRTMFEEESNMMIKKVEVDLVKEERDSRGEGRSNESEKNQIEELQGRM